MSTIDLNGLHARLTGPGRPEAVVVAAHGLCLSSASWSRSLSVLRRARPDVATLAYDHRDHGRSAASSSSPCIGSIADDLVEVLDHARSICSRVVLLGHSLGAMASLEAASRGLLSVDGLVLVGSSSGSLCDHGLLRAVPSALSARLPEFAQSHPSAFDLAWRAVRPALTPWLGAEAPHQGTSPRPSAVALASMLASLRDWSVDPADLESLRGVPASVVVGSGDMITPAAHSRRVAGALGTDVTTLPGGHNLHMEPRGAKACADTAAGLIDQVLAQPAPAA